LGTMIKIGNFFFHNRNWLFPFFYVVLFIPSIRISENYVPVLIIGLLVTLLGQMIRMTTIGLVYIQKGGIKKRINAPGLLIEGLFSHSRNPLYVGNVTLMFGMSIISNSLLAIFILFPFFVFIYQTIILAEENYLTDKFGTEYIEYSQRVNRWLFNFTGISTTLKDSIFNWKRSIREEYGTFFLWAIPATILVFTQFYRLLGEEYFVKYKLLYVGVFAFLVLDYLTLRYLKKSKKLSDKK